MPGDVMPQKSATSVKKHSMHKKVVFIVLALLFFGTVAVGGYLYFTKPKVSIYDQATSLSLEGKTKDAIALLDAALKKSDNKQEQLALINEKIVIYYNAKDFKNSLAMANQSFKIDPAYGTEFYIADIYEQMGDIEKAIEHCQRAIILLRQTTDPDGGSTVAHYIQKLNDLKSKVSE